MLLRVEKHEGASKDSSIDEEVPSMKVGLKVDDTPSMRDGKVIERNSSKQSKIRIKKAGVKYGNRVCFHCQKRGHIHYLQQVEERQEA